MQKNKSRLNTRKDGKHLRVPVLASEELLIKANAARASLTVAEYLRRLSLGHTFDRNSHGQMLTFAGGMGGSALRPGDDDRSTQAFAESGGQSCTPIVASMRTPKIEAGRIAKGLALQNRDQRLSPSEPREPREPVDASAAVIFLRQPPP